MPPSKVALVTGSGKRRIGWHVADALAARGYALALHYRKSAAEAVEAVSHFRSRSVEAVGLQADATDEEAVRKPLRSIRVLLGEIILALLGIYLTCGLLFGVPFVVVGAGRLDDAAQGTSITFRLLILPGAVAFWPLLAVKWVKQGTRGEGRGAGKCSPSRRPSRLT